MRATRDGAESPPARRGRPGTREARRAGRAIGALSGLDGTQPRRGRSHSTPTRLFLERANPLRVGRARKTRTPVHGVRRSASGTKGAIREREEGDGGRSRIAVWGARASRRRRFRDHSRSGASVPRCGARGVAGSGAPGHVRPHGARALTQPAMAGTKGHWRGGSVRQSFASSVCVFGGDPICGRFRLVRSFFFPFASPWLSLASQTWRSSSLWLVRSSPFPCTATTALALATTSRWARTALPGTTGVFFHASWWTSARWTPRPRSSVRGGRWARRDGGRGTVGGGKGTGGSGGGVIRGSGADTRPCAQPRGRQRAAAGPEGAPASRLFALCIARGPLGASTDPPKRSPRPESAAEGLWEGARVGAPGGGDGTNHGGRR